MNDDVGSKTQIFLRPDLEGAGARQGGQDAADEDHSNEMVLRGGRSAAARTPAAGHTRPARSDPAAGSAGAGLSRAADARAGRHDAAPAAGSRGQKFVVVLLAVAVVLLGGVGWLLLR